MATAEEKLAGLINKIMDERDARKQIESDPKAAGAALANDLREFLGEWRAEKDKRTAAGARKAPASSDDDTNILGALFGG